MKTTENNIFYHQLFISFFKIGTVLVGGGYVILPLLKDEIVEKNKWLSFEEVVDYYSISQCLPGVIVANTTVFIGYKLKGFYGALISLLGITLPAFIAIILIANLISQIVSLKIIESIFFTVSISVIILILSALRELYPKCIIDTTTFIIFILCTSLILGFHISPALVIIVAGIFGLIINMVKRSIKGKVK